MQRLMTFVSAFGIASGALAHEIGSDGSLLQTAHAASSPHHWPGLLLLLAIVVLALRFGRRQTRQD